MRKHMYGVPIGQQLADGFEIQEMAGDDRLTDAEKAFPYQQYSEESRMILILDREVR